MQYGDFSEWQRGALGEASDPDSILAEQLRFWSHTLTERGEDLLASKRGLVADRLSVAWASLSAEERSIAVPLLRHIIDLVSELA